MSTLPLTFEDLGKRLTDAKRIVVAFPPCADLFLSQIDSKDEEYDGFIFFKEYFERIRHTIFLDESNASHFICGGDDNAGGPNSSIFSLGGCLPPSCVTLRGIRGSATALKSPTDRIKRLFIGDLVWLFYFERMGIFKILGALLDDFANMGKFPIDVSDTSNELTVIILEAMVRQTKTGLASTVRDRDSSYRRVLGWVSESGRKLGLESQVNNAFNSLFHKFIQYSLKYYNDKRLATAIQGTAVSAKPSAATLVEVGNTILLLKRAFEPFVYSRNYFNTLNGIVLTIATIDLVKNLRNSLGIPKAYEQPYEFIPAAHDILVAKKPITQSEENTYELHRTCAQNGRDILLDIDILEVTELKDTSDTGALSTWLNLVEGKVESYRTAYRILTGTDLGGTEAPRIDQQP